MLRFAVVFAFACALNLAFAAANTRSSALVVRAPGTPGIPEIAEGFKRDIDSNGVYRRRVFSPERIPLDKGWVDAIVFGNSQSVNGKSQQSSSNEVALEITCLLCYVKGEAIVKLTVDDDFNSTMYIDRMKDSIESLAKDVFDEVEHDAQEFAETFLNNEDQGGLDKIDDFNITQDFNTIAQSIPNSNLRIELNGLELYAALRTRVSDKATYTLNLLTAGSGVSDKNFAGAVITLDLILSAEAALSIDSGFHIKLQDGTVINIPMFDDAVGNVTFNGGQFEFLPVTLASADIELQAILRIGAYLGSEVSVLGTKLTASAGVTAGIFADIADFSTAITMGNGTCEVFVEETYQLAVGAAAGASVALLDTTWGPTPNKTTALFSTTLGTACGHLTTSPATTSTALRPRAGYAKRDLLTTTLSTVETYTGVACRSAGLVNCPVSLQSTTKQSTTKFLTTAISDGETASFPTSTPTSVSISPVAFGSNAASLCHNSGTPVPCTSKSDKSKDDGNEDAKKRIITGVTIGLGVPVLLGAIVGFCIFYRRQKGLPARVFSFGDYDDTQAHKTVGKDAIKPVPHVVEK